MRSLFLTPTPALTLSLTLILSLALPLPLKAEKNPEPPVRDLILHVLNRMTFGPRPTELAQLEKTGRPGLEKWMRQQMNPDEISDTSLELKMKAYPSLDLEPKDAFAQYPNTKNQKPQIETKKPYTLVQDLIATKLIRAVESKKQFEQVLLDFWFNHFNVEVTKGNIKYFAADYQEKILRRHLFGKFEDLLLATAHHPAMLIYLDNARSRKGNINENYAREVMELHTLGVDGGYTQKDVETLAQILTGWTITRDNEDPGFVFRPKLHDNGATEFLGQPVMNQGEEQGVLALKQLAHSPHTARFISGKLIRAFVADPAPPLLLEKISEVFLKTNGDLRKVYEALFFSSEFLSLKHAHEKMKKPLWAVASSVRSCGGEVLNPNRLIRAMSEMGEDLYKCSPPTGYVDDPKRWINAGSMILRLQFALDLTSEKTDGLYCSWDFTGPAKNLDQWINQIARHHLNMDLKSQTLKVISREISQEPLEFANEEIRPSQYLKTLGLLLASPEFQER